MVWESTNQSKQKHPQPMKREFQNLLVLSREPQTCVEPLFFWGGGLRANLLFMLQFDASCIKLEAKRTGRALTLVDPSKKI